MIERQHFFDHSVKNDMWKYNFRKIKQVTDQGDDYTTGCPPYYPCFKENYNLRVIDDMKLRFSKQKVLDADPEAKQQVHFTRNLNRQDK